MRYLVDYKEAQRLLRPLGLEVIAMDPGVQAKWSEESDAHLDFGAAEWAWLRRILLRREQAADSPVTAAEKYRRILQDFARVRQGLNDGEMSAGDALQELLSADERLREPTTLEMHLYATDELIAYMTNLVISGGGFLDRRTFRIRMELDVVTKARETLREHERFGRLYTGFHPGDVPDSLHFLVKQPDQEG